MFTDSGNSHPEQLCHCFLGTPYRTVFDDDLHLALFIGHTCKILSVREFRISRRLRKFNNGQAAPCKRDY